VARQFSNPSWKVIVSASRGQCLKPGSFEPGFFLRLREVAAWRALCADLTFERLASIIRE
jgi:hypothetical protein